LHTPLGTAAKLFNLTLAESQVLGALLQGDTLEDASARIGKSRSTIKTHLESIFAKSGVNRQADLIRRVMELKTPFG
jgi:DNA-binding CsgD family transcriptional regulator